MSFLSLAGQSSHPRTGSHYGSYLVVHRQIRYFRITVPVPLQSILGKKEIRRSLDGLDSRTARTRAVRLALAAQTFFALMEDMRDGRIRLMQVDSAQSVESVSEVAKKLDTVWFDAVQKQGLSSAALALKLPFFLRKAGLVEESTGTEKKQEEVFASASENMLKPEGRISGMAPEPIRTKGDALAASPPDILIPRSHVSAKRLPTVFEAVAAYVKAKEITWSTASAKDIPPQIRQFAEIVRELEHGRDIPVDTLTRDHVRRYYDTLRHLPFRVNGRSEYKGMSWLLMAELGRAGKIGRLLSVKTMEVRQTNVRSFINWCELEYHGMVQARYLNSGFPKVLTDKDIRRKGVKRTAFTQSELAVLLGDQVRFLKATRGSAARCWSPWILCDS